MQDLEEQIIMERHENSGEWDTDAANDNNSGPDLIDLTIADEDSQILQPS